MIGALAFILGTVLGSFLNVCIYRIPRKISLVKPDSFCPKCGIRIPMYLNIPLLSYLLLKGRCRRCQERIPIQYPLVELLGGFLTLFTYLKFGLTPSFLFYAAFFYFLIVISFIDLERKLILNKVLVWMLAAGLGLNLVFHILPYQQSLLGFLAGGGLMLLFAFLGNLMFRKESMGMGDVKFAAVAGIFLGWKMIMVALFCGFLIAFLILISMMALQKTSVGEYIPLGPFLAMGLIIFVFWGNQLMNWYWQTFVMPPG